MSKPTQSMRTIAAYIERFVRYKPLTSRETENLLEIDEWLCRYRAMLLRVFESNGENLAREKLQKSTTTKTSK